MKTCAVPGCNITLHSSNWLGVCRGHNHKRGYCKCVQCRRKNQVNAALAKAEAAQPFEPYGMRVLTWDELVAKGLLPRENFFPLEWLKRERGTLYPRQQKALTLR